MTSHRLPSRQGELIDRSTSLAFTWNGKPYTGHEGDTIASALAAAGVEIFSRSMKYKRKRGILTADHWDPNLFVQVGDEPNVRAGSRRLRNGMVVSAQNVFPSLGFDLGGANRFVGRFLSAGFYYKTFMGPKLLWDGTEGENGQGYDVGLYQKVLRKFAPGGKVDWQNSTHGAYDKRYMHPDVLVTGGGPAGMAAALGAAAAGASVLLVEHEPELGGHLRWGDEADLAQLETLRSLVEADPGIEVMLDSTVTARYDHNWVAVMQRSHPTAPERLIKARAGSLVVAAGLVERPYVFKGNDTPGVILAGAARRLINLWAVKPGTKAVVLSANSEGDAAVADLEAAGVEVVAYLDARNGDDITEVEGRNRVRKVHLGDGRTVEADLVVTATGWTARRLCSTWPATARSTTRWPPATSPRTSPRTSWQRVGSPVTGRPGNWSPTVVPRVPWPPTGLCGPATTGGLPWPGPGTPRAPSPKRSSPTGPRWPVNPTQSATAAPPTAWSTTRRTCPPRTSSRPPRRASTRSS